MKIAFLGIGNVGSALADHLARLGHTVTIAARDPHSESVKQAQAKNSALVAKPLETAVDEAEIIFLATPYGANESALRSAGDLVDKILVDCTNPVGAGLTHGLNSEISGAETVQKLAPAAKVVKAFTIYGYENFEDTHYPNYGDLKPVMLMAGNDPVAKATVADLCRQLGWEPVDCGDLSLSLHLEHMTLLWIKMARVQGYGAGFTWAMLKR